MEEAVLSSVSRSLYKGWPMFSFVMQVLSVSSEASSAPSTRPFYFANESHLIFGFSKMFRFFVLALVAVVGLSMQSVSAVPSRRPNAKISQDTPGTRRTLGLLFGRHRYGYGHGYGYGGHGGGYGHYGYGGHHGHHGFGGYGYGYGY